MILKTFLANKNITLLDNPLPYNPPIKPDWWKDEHLCNYHRSKWCNTDNCYKLKDAIKDLIYGGKMFTNGLVKNLDHKAFRTPLP